MTNHADAPRVALVLYAFNEARFVEEAARSLFAQDYPNLEIVLSDDGSADGTWEIMQRLAHEYAGPHRVMLNHNATNIGIGSQINAAVAMSTGRLIVLANADDVSAPNRVSRCAKAWLESDPPATAVWSPLRQIDADGNRLGRVMPCAYDSPTLAQAVRVRIGGAHAASLALDRRTFDTFGPLPANLILEDNPLFLRALLIGKVVRIDEPLVDYRVHSNNISQSYAVSEFDDWNRRNHERLVWHRTQGVRAYIEILRDLHQRPAENWDRSDMARARWTAMEKLLENEIQESYYTGDRSVGDLRRLRTLGRLAKYIMKDAVKRALPAIERRNARNQYKSTLRAARTRD